MAITVFGSGEQLTEQRIADAEQQMGRSIPSAYRAFLLEHNGGYTETNSFAITDARTGANMRLAVGEFIGINHPVSTMNLDYKLRRFRDRIPSRMFPVASDPGGSLICIVTEGPETGRVYFWDHEEEADEGEPPTEENLYFIAESFDEFLNMLKDG